MNLKTLLSFLRPREKEVFRTAWSTCAPYCLKEKCPAKKWVILNVDIVLPDGKIETKSEGRCADGWIPQMLLEFRQELVKAIKEK